MTKGTRKPAAQVAAVNGGPIAWVITSVKFAVSVVILIALACIAGTFLPQGGEVDGFVQKYPVVGNWMPLLIKFAFTHLFYSWWFVTLLCVLAATVMTCTMRRLATVRRTAGFARRRALGSMITHVSILLILAGGVVRGVWGESGYLQFREGETTSEFQIENRVKPLPCAVQLAKFEILSDHKRTLVGEAPEKDTHQLVGQWPGRNLSLTSLQVVRDPGAPLVYAGFALPIAGLAIIFYLNPWLESRRAPA